MLRTKSGLPKHCSWNVDRHGKRRVRFRWRGFSTYLAGTPWSEDFMRRYAAALEGVQAQTRNVGAMRTKPGTIDALVVSYLRSVDWTALKPTTKAVRLRIIERELRIPHGDKPVRLLGRSHIKNLIGAKANTPEAANSLLKVLRILLAHAVDIGMLDSNPAIGVKRHPVRSEGFHTWSETEVAQFEAHHPIGSRARLALELLLGTAQRRSDVVRMGWQHVQGDCIAVRQEKTNTLLLIPINAPLAAALAALPRTNMTFLVTEAGKPFTSASFGDFFRDCCREAGLPKHCAAHGLRKAAATRLANAGCTAEMIKAITGHKTLTEVSRYTRAADQARLARQAVERLQTDAEQKLSNLETGLDKMGRKVLK
jgi:integrase